jgi:toxin ParE1/3/4
MSKPVRFARQARAELHEAADRYAGQRPELRVDFLAAIDEAIARMIRLAPHLGSPPGIEPTLGIKRIFVKRFPFSIYFIEMPTRFRVLAIAHGKRRPFYWGDRL